MLSDITRCEIAKTYVFTDQTQTQCAAEHKCPPNTVCPLGQCFTGSGNISSAMKPVKKRRK